ncbi:peripheral myelin protein 22-like [Sinocyclocheilus grahami]|uniref:Peripheral myelin protein 22-like n=1 Tax=Sinocyclocheilus grahami TaxID=75366 RepID=A0A672MFE6_SINGR|nr:PREDICTED: peripheral myelin protein 22-like [Sinocyclocheilus grahami]XP_016146401.1 PREDICTED: peripheral myelin protein 22-like [Sinocyclocheilus grahami]XP_016146402.1 PREDICTED: peripheral myelin protein 22-like [Sinocyclocheilus grahami]
MLAILFATIVLHLTDLIILFVSTCTNAWRTHGVRSYDLWYDCTQSNGGYHCRGTSDADWLQAVQALMVLATIFSLISFIIFLCQLFTLVKGGRFFFTAVFQVLASLFVMSGAIIYTVMSPEWKNESDGYGYAFVLAWLAFPLTLISGFIYIVLRKKE